MATTDNYDIAVAALKVRRESQPEHIDMGSLPAGAPMTYYCKGCGHISCVLPEDWITGYKKFCDPCQVFLDTYATNPVDVKTEDE